LHTHRNKGRREHYVSPTTAAYATITTKFTPPPLLSLLLLLLLLAAAAASQVAALVRSFPSEGAKEKGWRLVYSLTRDGASSSTLVEACAAHATYVLAVEDSWGYVFGASFR